MNYYTDYVAKQKRQYPLLFDTSNLSQKFAKYLGSQTRIKIQKPCGEIMFGRVGVTTGWKPTFLLMHNTRSRGSSTFLTDKDIILAEKFEGDSKYTNIHQHHQPTPTPQPKKDYMNTILGHELRNYGNANGGRIHISKLLEDLFGVFAYTLYTRQDIINTFNTNLIFKYTEQNVDAVIELIKKNHLDLFTDNEKAMDGLDVIVDEYIHKVYDAKPWKLKPLHFVRLDVILAVTMKGFDCNWMQSDFDTLSDRVTEWARHDTQRTNETSIEVVRELVEAYINERNL